MPTARLTGWPEQGRLAIVITGASSGIGAELAREAAREHQPLLLVARSAAALTALAEELTATAGEAHVLVLDLTVPGAAVAVGAALAGHGLVCDVLVNNAGYGLVGAAADLSAADQLGILDLNLRTAVDLALAAVPGMRRRQRGGVLNVGSIAGFLPGPGMALYYASKAGLRSFSEALWAEMRPHGVAISLLCPGPVRTPFLERSGAKRTRLFRMMSKATAPHVARRGWTGFRRGKRLIFPNAMSWLVARGAPLVPRWLLLGVLQRFQRMR